MWSIGGILSITKGAKLYVTSITCAKGFDRWIDMETNIDLFQVHGRLVAECDSVKNGLLKGIH